MKRWKRIVAVTSFVCSVFYWSYLNLRLSSHAIPEFIDTVSIYSTLLHLRTRALPSSELRRNVATVVPGFGHIDRLPLLNASLRALDRSIDDSVSFACIVYVWNAALLDIATEALDLCTVEYSKGLWTHHMLAVGTTSATASMIEAATHVIVLLDDMDAQSIRLPLLLDFMEEAQFDVAGPSVPDWHYPSIWTRPNCVAHSTGHIDILFTVFIRPMWHCWQNHIDININAFGWGYDLTMADLCHARIGVVDAQVAYHRPDCAAADKSQCQGSTYDVDAAMTQMFQWIKSAMKLNTTDHAREFYGYVHYQRPEQFSYCTLLRFHVVTETALLTPMTVDVSQWQSLVYGLNQTGYLTTASAKSLSHSVELVNVDVYFSSNRTALLKPWVGVVPSSQYIPPHFKQRAIMSLLTYSFRQSAPNCTALFAFTSTMATLLKDQLVQMGIEHIQVCTVQHPLPWVDSMFDPVTDIKAILSNSSVVVLINHHRDARVAILHQIQTMRQKIWLSLSTLDYSKEWATKATKLELRTEGATKNSSIRVYKLEISSGPEYNQLVRQNIVLVDGTSETVVMDAVLLAIALEAPFLVRKLEGVVEYLGEDYPLYFSSLAQVKDLLNNKQLETRLLEAHVYLKGLHMNANTTSDSLVREMLNCTLDAMALW